LDRLEIVAGRLGDAGRRNKMHHAFDAAQRFRPVRGTADFADLEGHPLGLVFRRYCAAHRATHRDTGLGQRPAQRRADEAVRAGDEHW